MEEKITTTKVDLEAAVEERAKELADERVKDAESKAKIDKDEIKTLVEDRIAKMRTEDKVPFAETQNIKLSDEDEKSRLGMAFMALGKSHLENMKWDDAFKKQFGGKEISQIFPQAYQKQMSASDATAGGTLIPEMWANDIIPYLQSEGVFRKAGLPTIDMPQGNLTFPKTTGTPSMYWRGEGKPRTKSKPTTGSVKMTSKIGYIDVPVSDQLLKYGGNQTARWITQQITQRFANSEDYYIMFGTGSAHQIKGIEDWALSANKNSQTGATSANILTDLLKVQKLLKKNDVQMSKPAWFFHPIDVIGIMSKVDGSNNAMGYARELSEKGTLYGYPVYETTRLPTGNSKWFLVDLSYLIMGQSKSFNLKFKEGGTYYDGSNYIPGDATGESVFTAEIEEDLIATQPAAISQINSCTWGA